MSYITQLQEKFLSLSTSLQNAIRSEENNTFLVNLAKKYMLNDDQQMDLVQISAYVILGEISRADFARRIAGIDGVGEQAAQALAKAIDEKLFAPLGEEIDEALKKRIPLEQINATDEEAVMEPEAQPLQIKKIVPPSPLPPNISQTSETHQPAVWQMPREASPAPTAAPEQPEKEVVETAPPIAQEEPSPARPQADNSTQPETDQQATPDVITIPTITVTKPPRFIPLKDLKQGSVKSRPAPQGIPSRDTMPNFQKASTIPTTGPKAKDAIHTLKNDAPVVTPTPVSSSSVLPRIEPTPEKLASTLVPPQPQIARTPSAAGQPPTPPTPTPRAARNDPYHEPIDETGGEPSQTTQDKSITTP